MDKRAQILVGTGLLLVALVAPFAVHIADPLEDSPLPTLLLELRSLDATQISDALQLRLGLLANYDSVAARQRELEQKARAFTDAAEHLDASTRAPILAAFAAYRAQLATRGATLESFPNENATLNNSLRLLTATYERAREHVSAAAEPDAGLLDALRLLQLHTLQYYAGSQSDAREQLLLGIDELARRYPDAKGSVAAMLGHARIVSEEKGRVDDDVRALTLSSGEPTLLATFAVLERECHWTSLYTERKRALLSGSCVLAAVITCALGALTVLRQNAALAHEIQERVRADQEARKLEAELRQRQKLESVGQLAAGIAHEINTPAQYVADNTSFLRDSFAQVLSALEEYRALVVHDASPDGAPALAAVDAALDLDFLRTEIPRALAESADGLGRISTIVKAMKSFSHPSSAEITPSDINAAIRSTTTVARSEWKYVADLELELAPDLPLVPCSVGEFNQVVLNMLVNAAHAVAAKEGVGTPSEVPRAKGVIRISTRVRGDQAELRISDTGTGIPPEVLPRIFDPFFTTKEVGKGTGQGLAIAHSVIVEKHGGTIDVETEPGRGTTFVVRLPLVHAPAAAAA